MSLHNDFELSGRGTIDSWISLFFVNNHYMNIFQQKAKEKAAKNAEEAKAQADFRKKRDAIDKAITKITGVTPKKELFGLNYKTKTYTIHIYSIGWITSKYKWEAVHNNDYGKSSCETVKGKTVCRPKTKIDYDKLYAELRAELTKKYK